jgi:hypothetical protein
MLNTGVLYDPENRMTMANSGTQLYAYDGQNKRIWTCTLTQAFGQCQSETYYFYSPQGKLMAQFTPQYQSGTFSMVNGAVRPYFGGRLVGAERWPRFPRQVLPVRRGSIEPATGQRRRQIRDLLTP